MSALDTHLALSDPDLQGTQRLARLVLALHADHRGQVAIGVRDLGRMCGVSHASAADALQALAEKGLTEIVERGQGAAASVYRLTRKALPQQQSLTQTPQPKTQAQVPTRKSEPDTPPQAAVSVSPRVDPEPSPPVRPDPQHTRPPPEPPPERLPAWCPPGDVGRVLAAARVAQPVEQPFYWHRLEHATELAQITFAARVTIDQLCMALKAIAPQPGARRIGDLVDALKRGGRA